MENSWKWKILSVSEIHSHKDEGDFSKSICLYDFTKSPEKHPPRAPVLCEVGTEELVLTELTLTPHGPPFAYRERIWRYSTLTADKEALSMLQSPLLVRKKLDSDSSLYPRLYRGGDEDVQTSFPVKLYQKFKRRRIVERLALRERLQDLETRFNEVDPHH